MPPDHSQRPLGGGHIRPPPLPTSNFPTILHLSSNPTGGASARGASAYSPPPPPHPHPLSSIQTRGAAGFGGRDHEAPEVRVAVGGRHHGGARAPVPGGPLPRPLPHHPRCPLTVSTFPQMCLSRFFSPGVFQRSRRRFIFRYCFSMFLSEVICQTTLFGEQISGPGYASESRQL